MTKRGTIRRKRKKKDAPVQIARPERALSRRPFVLILLSCLLLAGIATRVYFLDRSLWLDEAWVANSLQAPNLKAALYYEEWLQTSPPLFVAVSRIFVSVFGTSNIALRALPAVAAIIAIAVFSFVALRFLRPSFALVAIGLFIFSPRLIQYSQSVKQYSTDVFSTIGLLALGLVYLQQYSDRRFHFLIAGFVLLSFLSYATMLFFPFVLVCAMTKVDFPAQTRTLKPSGLNWPRGAVVAAIGMFVAAANYFFFIAPNRNPALAAFFADGFYQGSSLVDFLWFHGANLSTLSWAFFFGGPGPLRVIAFVLILIGFVFLWMPLKDAFDVKAFHTALLLTAPIAGVVALNMAGFFPIPGFHHRLLLFAFPLSVLLLCLGLQFVVNLASRSIAAISTGWHAAAIENALGGVVFFAMVALAWLFFSTVGLRPHFDVEHEDSEEAVAYLRRQVQTSDILYVHATMLEQFKLYSRKWPVRANRIVLGKIGMPCCPRKDFKFPWQETEKDINDEIFALWDASAGGRVWLLITNRALHWFYTGRNHVQIFERGLARTGCEKFAEEKFTGVYVAGFACRQK